MAFTAHFSSLRARTAEMESEDKTARKECLEAIMASLDPLHISFERSFQDGPNMHNHVREWFREFMDEWWRLCGEFTRYPMLAIKDYLVDYRTIVVEAGYKDQRLPVCHLATWKEPAHAANVWFRAAINPV